MNRDIWCGYLALWLSHNTLETAEPDWRSIKYIFFNILSFWYHFKIIIILKIIILQETKQFFILLQKILYTSSIQNFQRSTTCTPF